MPHSTPLPITSRATQPIIEVKIPNFMTQLLSKLSERRDGGESARPLGASK
jgi:hypothetical protein